MSSDRIRKYFADWRERASSLSVQLNVLVLLVVAIGVGLVIGQIVTASVVLDVPEEPQPQYNDSAVNVTAKPPQIPAPQSPIWCPKGYKLLLKHRFWWNACVAQSCHSNNNCTDLSDGFNTCRKSYTPSGQYRIGDDGTAIVLADKTRFDWGSYWVMIDDTLVTCGGDNAAQSLICGLYTVDRYRWVSGGAVVVDFWPREMFKPGMYAAVGGNASEVTVCRALRPTMYTCVLYPLRLPDTPFTIAANKDLVAHVDVDVVYGAADYMLSAEDRSVAAACVQPPPEEKTPLTQLMYACFAAVSAAFLFLALLAHVFYPKLNYHAKALLCHTVSLLVTYVCMSVQWFVAYREKQFDAVAPRLVFFCLQYVFGLAAFFWLNVLAFDLWKVFANMEGSFTTGQGKKRAFLFKCAYAFGIPVWLCALTVYVGLNHSIQSSLNIKFLLLESIWFAESKPLFIFFYTPVIIILIENIVFFILTILNFKNTSKSVSIINKKVGRQLFKVCLKLVIIMGLCWTMEIVAWIAQYRVNQTAWYFTDIINLLQGVFIFIIYVVKRKTLKMIRNALGCPLNNIVQPQVTRNTKLSTDTIDGGRKTSVEIIPIQLT